jgi:hypothetical protein
VTDRTEEIRARVAKVTPGPWHLFTNRHPTSDGQRWGCVEKKRHPAGGAGTPLLDGCYWTGERQRADADLIAHAPADLAWLLAENDRLRAALNHISHLGVEDTGTIGLSCHWHHEAAAVALAALDREEDGDA